ncbi:sulfatase domain-containing protein [Pochonia chlamydosporia 170]|uniref:Sulfatase domain-containing protein n=1 Tax=Pochonia chlamydosporia 170 TaxID=1380566 RepID=A0A179FWP5_METCM|nr:sulfatase domain-containing protein [Pochonia chlamydosporia 170]OAQ70096.1 sulfatase domain-containing protein [Pochonia chlamydosporia 170]
MAPTCRLCLHAGRFILKPFTLLPRLTGRRLLFSIAATSILSAKCLHLYAHIEAMTPGDLARWWPTFFAQDLVILLLLRLLLDDKPQGYVNSNRALQLIAVTVASFLTAIHLALSSVNLSFFALVGSEIRWRNISVATDSSSRGLLLTGLWAVGLAFAAVMLTSCVLMSVNYFLAGFVLDSIKAPFSLIFSKIPWCGRFQKTTGYTHLPNDEEGFDAEVKSVTSESSPPKGRKCTKFLYGATCIMILVQMIASYVRPIDTSFIFVSWTPILLPFIDLTHSSSTLAKLRPVYNESLIRMWDDQTSLTAPEEWAWLPQEDGPVPGFEDWYHHTDHYNAKLDPFNQPNFEDDLLAELRGKLGQVDIRHVVLVMLESTRKDVFPLKKDGYIWNTIAASWDNKTIPPDVQARLANLTTTANYLTGEYNDGFNHNTTRRRGGINVHNNHPVGTYTLKSTIGALCGTAPLVADMNVDYLNHLSQPCLPHIFKAFNALDHSKDQAPTEHYTQYRWNTSYMLSVTGIYDKQDELMYSIGYTPEEYITKEYLQSETAAFGPTPYSEVRWQTLSEHALEDYIDDAFRTAQQNNTRVFLTHLTGSSHAPWSSHPDGEYSPLTPKSKLEDLSNYLNGIGYVDSWLQTILDIIDKNGATNETLLVFVGDHGLSLPEIGAISPYYIPNIGGFHVPLVFSHPHLPAIDIPHTPVNSISILPTILDLLIETGSLSPSDSQAARHLLHNQEGLSLLRPLEKETTHWQFTVMSPGGAQISTRSVRNPRWRIVVPVVEDIEWRFTDVEADPHELEHVVMSFDFAKFLGSVEREFGREAAMWAEEAAFVTRWWVDENAKRWRYSG